jgi:hypothetical protein
MTACNGFHTYEKSLFTVLIFLESIHPISVIFCPGKVIEKEVAFIKYLVFKHKINLKNNVSKFICHITYHFYLWCVEGQSSG